MDFFAHNEFHLRKTAAKYVQTKQSQSLIVFRNYPRTAGVHIQPWFGDEQIMHENV